MPSLEVVEDLTDAEQAHRHDDEVDAVGELEAVEGEPACAAEAVASDRGQEQAEGGRHQRLEHVAAADGGDQEDTEEREQGTHFAPKFDAAGLLTAVVVDAGTGAVLVVAHMNQEALDATLASGRVHFWSRSRGQLWLKGETSGHFLDVAEVLTDCDQDALVIRARPAGPTCHTGSQSCFYRRVESGEGDPVLVRVKT